MTRRRQSSRAFFEHVYEVVRMVPYGQVATYGQIAEIVSHRGAARTVGWALRALPSDHCVPWHRVINARGTISTGSGLDGTCTQRVLLEGEGVVFGPGGTVDLSTDRWPGLTWPEVEDLRQKWSSLQDEMPGG